MCDDGKDVAIVIDVKNARSRPRLRRSGGQKDFGQMPEVDRLAEPIQYIEPGRSHIAATACWVAGDHDDRRVAMMRLSAYPENQVDAVVFPKPKVDQNRRGGIGAG